MTALLYVLAPRRAYVAMDSRVCAADGSAARFASKLCVLPHVGVVVCGTGLGNLLFDWIHLIQQRIDAHDILELDQVTPVSLRRLWHYAEPHGTAMATIYHFGYAVSLRRFVGFAYRSCCGFASYRLGDGFGADPAEGLDLQAVARRTRAARSDRAMQRILHAVLEDQRQIDAHRAPALRRSIGGPAHLVAMRAPRDFRLLVAQDLGGPS